MFNRVNSIGVVQGEPVFSSNSKHKVIPSAKKVLEPPPPLLQHSGAADNGEDHTEDGMDRNPPRRDSHYLVKTAASILQSIL